MRRDLQRRLQRLEVQAQSHNPVPLVVVIDPVEADGSVPTIDAYMCRETGDRWERRPDEALPDFQQRVEDAARCLPGAPMLIFLTPTDWPTTRVE